MKQTTSCQHLREAVAAFFDEPQDFDVEELRMAYRLSPQYIIQHYGVDQTVAFLRSKGKTAEEIENYVAKAADWQDYITVERVKSDNANNTTAELDSDTTVIAAVPPSEAFAPIAEDTDTHRFTLGDVLRLENRLTSHELWQTLLDHQNDILKSHSRGKVTARIVAFIGCLWRKNIRTLSPDREPGAVPFESVSKFIARDNTIIPKSPDNLQIKAAISLLEDLQFLKRCRAGITRDVAKQMGVKPACATYRLVNEREWE